MEIRQMITRSERETGCMFCRGLIARHGSHIVLCGKYKREVLLKKKDCEKFQRGLDSEAFHEVKLFSGCTALFSGIVLNHTDINSGELISESQFFELLKVSALYGKVQVSVVQLNN